MVKCDNCGTDNTDEDTFCSICGEPLKHEKTTNDRVDTSKLNLKLCENCGMENTDEDTFCSQCGEPLNNDRTTNNDASDSKFNLKLIIPIVAIVLIAIGGFTMLNSGTTVVLDTVEFNIPNGFYETNSNVYDFSEIKGVDVRNFINKNNDFISVSVSQSSGYSQQDVTKAINSGKFTAKNINGYDGGFQIRNSGYGFLYNKGNKIVVVYSSDESLLRQVVK